MKLNRMSESELEQYQKYCVQTGNVHALSEINDFLKYHGKMIEVIGGKKIPKGVKGIVFYVERIHYGSSEWFGWSTRIGFKDECGQAFFTGKNNIHLIAG